MFASVIDLAVSMRTSRLEKTCATFLFDSVVSESCDSRSGNEIKNEQEN